MESDLLKQLRADQVKAVCELRDAFESGKKSPCLVMPTGSGKTATILSYLDRHEPYTKVVWLEPRAALVEQVRASAREWMECPNNVDVTTVQGILARNETPDADLCIVDEAHYFYGTSVWSNIAHHYPRRIAATATPTRADGRALGELSDCLVVGLSRAALTRLKILPPVITVAPPERRSTEAWSPRRIYQRKTPGERAVVFCGSVEHAQNVAASFREDGIRAGCANNEEELAAHRAGDLEVLTNVYMVSVGYDDPTITVAILARPFGNASSYLQALGRARGLGAERVMVLDCYGALHEWGLPEEDRLYSLKGTAIKVAKKTQPLVACAVCEAMYRPNPFLKECALCRAPVEKFKTPIEKRRAEMEERRKADTIQAKRGYFVKMAQVGRSLEKPWLARSSYKSRYGMNPPIEWLAEFGLV